MGCFALPKCFIDECVDVSNGYVVCGCWTIDEPVWGGMRNVYVGDDDGFILVGSFVC